MRKNERYWVKFHFKSQQGIRNLTDAEAEAIIGKDRESHQRDLYESIERGDFRSGRSRCRSMPEADAASALPSRSISPRSGRIRTIRCRGRVMELNRNPENFFAEVEQSAFNPANIVPGIGFSPDKMLQGRLFSYGDAQATVFGGESSPHSGQRARCRPQLPPRRSDAVDGNHAAGWATSRTVTVSGGSSRRFAEPPLKLSGDADHWNFRKMMPTIFRSPARCSA